MAMEMPQFGSPFSDMAHPNSWEARGAYLSVYPAYQAAEAIWQRATAQLGVGPDGVIGCDPDVFPGYTTRATGTEVIITPSNLIDKPLIHHTETVISIGEDGQPVVVASWYRPGKEKEPDYSVYRCSNVFSITLDGNWETVEEAGRIIGRPGHQKFVPTEPRDIQLYGRGQHVGTIETLGRDLHTILGVPDDMPNRHPNGDQRGSRLWRRLGSAAARFFRVNR